MEIKVTKGKKMNSKNLQKKEDSDENCLFKWVTKQELDAEKFGFYWEHIDQLIEQIQSECREVQEAFANKDKPHLQEEIGDLIQAAISLAVFCKLDPRETLLKSIEKFQRRYDIVVELARSEGYESLHNQSFETLMGFWNRAKDKTKNMP
jgi:uncharacterized protein YabN with tetrapyrrole methylase and pyrophosphatase domain